MPINIDDIGIITRSIVKPKEKEKKNATLPKQMLLWNGLGVSSEATGDVCGRHSEEEIGLLT